MLPYVCGSFKFANVDDSEKQNGGELGYYDLPRTASHEDVAAVTDCAPSTAAEHIRKAESKLNHAVIGP